MRKQSHAPPLASIVSVELLCMLPALDAVKMAYMYTSVPLHFVDQRWPLDELGLMLTLAYVPRLLFTYVTAVAGDWVCVPGVAVGLVSSLVMACWPMNRLCVYVGVLGASGAMMTQPHRGLVFRRFGCDDGQQRRAMRVFTFSEVCGYSAGAMLGGVLYDRGTFVACAWFQAAAMATQLCLTWTLPPVWQVTRAALCHRPTRVVASESQTAAANATIAPLDACAVTPTTAVAVLPADATESVAAGKPAAQLPDLEKASPPVTHTPRASSSPASLRAAGVLVPASLVFAVTFTNLFVYGM